MKKLAIFFVSSKNLTTFALAIPKGVLKTSLLEDNAPLAQLVEQLTLNQWVQGSNP